MVENIEQNQKVYLYRWQAEKEIIQWRNYKLKEEQMRMRRRSSTALQSKISSTDEQNEL